MRRTINALASNRSNNRCDASSLQTASLVLQLYLWNRTPFVVPILGDALVPAAPHGPGQNTLHALLGGQHEAPEEAPNLTDAQRHPKPREALNPVRVLSGEPHDIFFDRGAWGRFAARSTVKSA